MKKVVCGFLAAVMLSPAYGVFALETEVLTLKEEASQKEEVRTYTLSLEEAKEMAYTGNLQIEAVEYKKKGYDIALDSAKISKSKYKDLPVSVSTAASGLLVKKGYYVELYRSQAELTKLELEKVKNQISYDVTEKYYNYKLTEALVKTCETSTGIAASNFDTVKKQFEIGLATQLDVDGASAAYESAKVAEESYKRGLELAKENLKISLNINEPCNFVLTDGIEYKEFESDVEADIEAAVKTRYDIKGLEESTRLAELNYTIMEAALTDASEAASTAKSNYIQAQYALDSSTKLIKLGIKSAYNDIITAKSNVRIAEINVQINRQKLKAGQLKYEMGMITNDQLTAIMNDLSQSEIAYEQAKLDYKLSQEKYGYEITIGL